MCGPALAAGGVGEARGSRCAVLHQAARRPSQLGPGDEQHASVRPTHDVGREAEIPETKEGPQPQDGDVGGNELVVCWMGGCEMCVHTCVCVAHMCVLCVCVCVFACMRVHLSVYACVRVCSCSTQLIRAQIRSNYVNTRDGALRPRPGCVA